jgi:[ribosomal protein S5]-alanine N-acetyltransferase
MRIIVTTQRLVVREYQPADIDLLLALYNDPEVNRFVSHQTDDQRRERFATTLEEYKHDTGLHRWGIFSTVDDDFIGTCKLMPNDTDPDKIELGYVLAQKYWGKGIATELAKALVDYGFNEKGLTDIYACVNPENTASQNVLLKSGFLRVGYVFWHDKDLYFFSINRSGATIIAETDRLIVREFLPDEEETYLHHFTDPEVALYLPKRSREERVNIFHSTLAAYAGSKQLGMWGIFNKADGDFMGTALLRLFAGAPEKIELGYSMEKRYWGKGLGTEMATALVKYTFAHKADAQMVAVTILENIGSQRVLEKAGFKRKENLLRDGLELAYFELNK